LPASDPQGDLMTKQPVDSPQPSEEQPSSPPSSRSHPQKSGWSRILLPVLVVAVALTAAYWTGWLAAVVGLPAKSGPEEPMPAVVATAPSQDLFSSGDALRLAGRSPGDPGRTAFPAFEKSVVPDGKSCPPLLSGAAPSQTAPPSEPVTEPPGQPNAVSPRTLPAPRQIETPVISSREPVATEPQAKKKPGAGPRTEKPEGSETGPTATGRPTSDPDHTAASPEDKSPKTARTVASPFPRVPTPGPKRMPARQEIAREEPFQLPGSLLVKIHNYTGSSVQWGMMVILDDSTAMAAKIKPWNPNPSAAAVSFVGKLPSIMPPGSKMAVRDFFCKNADSGKKAGPCLSHMLLDWSADPSKQLKEKLAELKPAGTTNPCSAVAFSAKKDFSELGKLVPRMLVITRGLGKCDHKGALAALQKTGSKEKISVDVIALGMSSKRERGYATLVKKTDGVFIKADKPADMDQALSRYEKTLKKKIVEKVEVRGEKATYSPHLNEEITVAPGTYTVVLPTVAGVQPSARTIPNVKVGSGEAKVLDVRVKKGKVQVRAGKK